jgi:hypothetical protein
MATIQEILTKNIDKCRLEIIDRHTKAGQKASGKTARSFKVKVKDYVGQLLGAEWAGTLQYGRKAGKVPFDFKRIIISWAKAKVISFANVTEANKFAWFMTWKIKREGTKRFKNNEDIFTTPIKNLTENLTKEIGAYYVTEIKNKINERTK